MTPEPLLLGINFDELWTACRAANRWLGAAAWFVVSVRFGMMISDRARWRDRRALHLIAWFAWIVLSLFVSILGSAYYAGGTTPANYVSGLRSLLHIAAFLLAVWWPHPAHLLHIEHGHAPGDRR